MTTDGYDNPLVTWNPMKSTHPFIVAQKHMLNNKGEITGSYLCFIQWNGETYDEVWHGNQIDDNIIELQVCDTKGEGRQSWFSGYDKKGCYLDQDRSMPTSTASCPSPAAARRAASPISRASSSPSGPGWHSLLCAWGFVHFTQIALYKQAHFAPDSATPTTAMPPAACSSAWPRWRLPAAVPARPASDALAAAPAQTRLESRARKRQNRRGVRVQ